MKPLDVCFRGCLNGANSLVYQTPSSLHIHLDSDLWAALFLSSHAPLWVNNNAGRD